MSVLHYHEFEDEEGSLASVAQRCAEGLVRCLERAEDENLRDIILTSLFELYCEDLDLGGYGIGDGIPDAIVKLATPEERQKVARWVEAVIPREDGWRTGYQRGALGQFLLHLRHDTLDDEIEEHADTAYQLVLERSRTGEEGSFLEWLKTWHERRGEIDEAFEYSATLFWRRPYLETYKEMRRLGERTSELQPGWQARRETLLSELNQKEHYALLTEVYLLDGAVDAALGSLAQLERIGRSSNRLSLAVARAAERSRPREAIKFYRAEINRLIEARGRRSYAEAAQHLLRVGELYERLGEIDAWEGYLRGLREDYKRLRALQEELTKVGWVIGCRLNPK